MYRHCFAAAAAFIATASFAAAQGAAALIEKHTKAAAEELEGYLEKSPDAADADEAVDYLIEAYTRLDMGERKAELLTGKYETLGKGADLSPPEFFGVVQELFQTHLGNGDKEAAKALIATAKTDAGGHPQADRFTPHLDRMLSELDKPGIGDSMEIKFTSLQGEEIDLAGMGGKVVLVDFWATWCGPCIAELPNVKKAYEAHHADGFEIIGISLDREGDKEKLENFIKEHEMPWPQAFDGGGWQASLAQKFGINSIPATYLIGKDGTVVAADLRGPALEAAVAKELAK